MIKKIFKHKIILFSCLFIIICAVILIFIYQQMNSSVSVSLSSTASNSSTDYDINLTPKTINDKYISFKYPKGLTLKSAALAGANSVDSYNFEAKDVSSWMLGIDVSTAPGATITNLSSYKYRQENPSEFSLSNEVINSMPVAIMTDNTFSGFSKVAYISNGIYVATISLVGEDASGNAPLNTTFNLVLNSWTWH